MERFLAAIKSGKAHAHSVTDKMTVLDLLEPEGPTPFMISRIDGATHHGDKTLREKAHRMARAFGPAVEGTPDVARWNELLRSSEGPLLVDVVRSARQLGTSPEIIEATVARAPELIAAQPGWKEDLAAVIVAWPSGEGWQGPWRARQGGR